jgi:hypothetical protein
MKKNLVLRNVLFLLLLCLIILASCQQRPQQQQQVSKPEISLDSFRLLAVNVLPAYNSVSDIPQLLSHVNVKYYPGIVNDINNIERYTNNDLLEAANIGVYFADIAYSYAFEDKEMAVASYIAAMSLAENFRITGIKTFLGTFLEHVSVSEAEVDTILFTLERDLQTYASQLTDNEQIRLYTSLIKGNFIEKNYLLYTTISRYPDSPVSEDIKIENLQKLVWIASGQKTALGELNKILNDYTIPEDDRIYHDEFIGLEKQMNETAFLADTSAVRTIELVSSPEFVNLYDEITRVRKLITEP